MDIIIIIGIWIAGSFFIAALGSTRKISGIGALIVSLIFTPVIGLIVVLFSDKKEKD